MTIKEKVLLFIYFNLEDRIRKTNISPEIIDDLYVGLVGFSNGHPMAKFTEDHNIQYNPDNIHNILWELTNMVNVINPLKRFEKRKLFKRSLRKKITAVSKISLEERLIGIRKILEKNGKYCHQV